MEEVAVLLQTGNFFVDILRIAAPGSLPGSVPGAQPKESKGHA
jgi:hypothetical protein